MLGCRSTDKGRPQDWSFGSLGVSCLMPTCMILCSIIIQYLLGYTTLCVSTCKNVCSLRAELKKAPWLLFEHPFDSARD